MYVFGENWRDHYMRIEEAWREEVAEQDTVIVLGDISWALKTEDAIPDLEWIHALPGKKILIRGNHDLWWHGVTNLNALWRDEILFLQNTCVMLDGFETMIEKDGESLSVSRICVCGSRGWALPGLDEYGKSDEKILAREVLRLKLSLDNAVKAGAEAIICALHFPPAVAPSFVSPFTELIEASHVPVIHAVYGHLHTPGAFRKGIKGNRRGIEYSLASADFLDFRLLRIL